MDANQATGAATGLLMLGLALTGALFALAVAAPNAAAHENCYSLTPTGCGSCNGTQPHSHYLVGPVPVSWCLLSLKADPADRADFRVEPVEPAPAELVAA